MDWNLCSKCKREFIIDDGSKDELCFQCWWENEVEKTEISLETIRKFMEKWMIFGFDRGEYAQILKREDENYPEGYFLETKISKIKEAEWWTKNKLDTTRFSVFLKKLFLFAKEQKIERINAEYELSEWNEPLFKIFKIVIEKKHSKS